MHGEKLETQIVEFVNLRHINSKAHRRYSACYQSLLENTIAPADPFARDFHLIWKHVDIFSG